MSAAANVAWSCNDGNEPAATLASGEWWCARSNAINLHEFAQRTKSVHIIHLLAGFGSARRGRQESPHTINTESCAIQTFIKMYQTVHGVVFSFARPETCNNM